jgi:hypothetical protein
MFRDIFTVLSMFFYSIIYVSGNFPEIFITNIDSFAPDHKILITLWLIQFLCDELAFIEG